MLIDFHTHSTASDGLLPPAELLARAQRRGVEALALTDHDTVAGYRAALEHPIAGLTLVPGVELSCHWGGATIHIVGLGMKIDDGALQHLLVSLDQLRRERAESIALKLARLGMPGALEGAQRLAGAGPICRPHFANWLVAEGHVDRVAKAFDKWLGNGKSADVKTQWPALQVAVAAITDAKGVAVLAHPLNYRFTRTKLRALCSEFALVGGAAIEIVNGRQAGSDIALLKRLAEDMGLAVSIGSDFHREWAHGADLGVDTAVAGDLPTVWELLF